MFHLLLLAFLGSTTAVVLDRNARPTPAPRWADLAARADLITTVVTTSVFPGGVATGNTRQESTLPLPCIDGCWSFYAPYYYCFINAPVAPNGTVLPRTCGIVCNQDYYNGLSSCLNCIVANGGERPFGYATNSSITANPTPQPIGDGPTRPDQLYNPNGLVDLAQANGWLKNMTDYCAANLTLTGQSSVTALPTTTGPYFASYTSGQTVTRSIWTGLTQYSPPLATYTFTRSSSSGTQQTAGAAASQSSRAAGVETAQGSFGWMVAGGLLAWAVV